MLSFQKNKPQNVVVCTTYYYCIVSSWRSWAVGKFMPTWQFFHITTKVGRSSLTFLLPTTTGHLPKPADYSVPTIDHIAGWLAVLYAISRTTSFLRSGDSKKMGTKVGSIAVSPCCCCAAAHYHRSSHHHPRCFPSLNRWSKKESSPLASLLHTTFPFSY